MKSCKQYPFLLAFCFLLLNSCSYETKTYNFATAELNIVAEGPLFGGSNTATAIWKINPEEFFDNKNPKDLKFAKGKVTRIIISSDSGTDLPKLNSVVVEIAAPETSMIRLGILEENILSGNSYELKLAENQDDLYKFFYQNEITFVADVNMLDEEYYDDLELKILVEFEFETKE
jgi:hypothetical protein